MSAVETIKVKADNAKGHRVINRSSFDPKVHKLVEGDKPDREESEADRLANEETQRDAARRKVEANRGQVSGAVVEDYSKNPSGTFSEPTPTDVRYPNKNETEFENNHGAFVSKSAAEIREEKGLPDKAGGLNPKKKEAEDAKAADARTAMKRARDGEPATESDAEATDFDHMTVAEMREYAEAHDIDLGDAHLKADIAKKLKKA
jgi:hypothetical protein